jgi:hypothetical protein
MKLHQLLHEATGMDRLYLDHPFYGRETIGEFLKRRGIEVSADGKFTLYHARPLGATNKTLRAWTYLEPDPEQARFFAARDRGLDAQKDIEVLPLRLEADDIEPGVHITLARDVPVP